MSLIKRYGNLVSGLMGYTLPKPDAKVGDEATILWGRDRKPAKVVEIVLNKKGKIAGFMLQEYEWTMDMNSEGYAEAIHWDKPKNSPELFKVVTHGKLKGTVKDALIGHADPFYDRSF